MIIQNNIPTNALYTPKIQSKPQHKAYPVNSDTVSFSGHVGIERYAKKGIETLKHETAFFRESQTDNFVKDYIMKNFASKNKIKIISGGCSTGEEAVTYSMLLDNIRDKVDILGFDLSKKSIKQANKRTYLFQQPFEKDRPITDMLDISGFKDSYLAFDNKVNLTPEQKKNKKLFDEFFEPSDADLKEQMSLSEKIRRRVVAAINKEPLLRFDRRSYQLKANKATNCKFIQGDINDIENIVGNEKADVILFRNAMYHLTTEEVGYDAVRVPKENSEAIVKKVATGMKNSLNDNGLIVFGKDEPRQMLDDTTVPKVMKELGFKPLNKTKDHAANVWQKV